MIDAVDTMRADANRPGAACNDPGLDTEEVTSMRDQPSERRYQMTRVGKGDWLLPSNDRQTLWRIHTYDEDGSAEYQDETGWHKIVGTFWATAKYNGDIPDDRPLPEDFLEWHRWTPWAGPFSTRGDAIKDVIR